MLGSKTKNSVLLDNRPKDPLEQMFLPAEIYGMVLLLPSKVAAARHLDIWRTDHKSRLWLDS